MAAITRATVFTVAGLAVVLAAGCTSAQKRAQEAMEKGSYDEAARTYERILQRSPNDPEARAGLSEARSMILDRRLIEVRKARSSGSPGDAARMLLEILAQEKSWGVRPKGAAVATQLEETGFAATHVLGTLKESLAESRPLKAERIFRVHEPLFQESRTQEFQALRESHRKQGKAECRKLAQEDFRGAPRMAVFVIEYCAFWGEKVKSLKNYDERELTRGLFRDVDLKSTVSEFPAGMAGEYQAALSAELRKTPWGSAQADGAFELALSGSWSAETQRNQTQLVHSYNEEERYVAYEDVRKSREVPYEAVEQIKNPATGAMESVTRVRRRTEYYTEKEPRERVRPVARTYPYGGWRLTQSLKLSLAGEGSLGARKVSVSFQDQSRIEDTESDAAAPNIGLKPKAPTLLADPTGWLRARKESFAQRFRERLLAEWKEAYCGDLGGVELVRGGESVRRCLQLAEMQANPPKSADEWHRKHFGLSTRETLETLQSGRDAENR